MLPVLLPVGYLQQCFTTASDLSQEYTYTLAVKVSDLINNYVQLFTYCATIK